MKYKIEGEPMAAEHRLCTPMAIMQLKIESIWKEESARPTEASCVGPRPRDTTRPSMIIEAVSANSIIMKVNA